MKLNIRELILLINLLEKKKKNEVDKEIIEALEITQDKLRTMIYTIIDVE